MAGPSCLHLPILALAYSQRSRRQDDNWTYRQAFMNSFLKVCLRNYTMLHYKWPILLKPRAEGKRFTLIEPASPKFYTGVVVDENIHPETIGATWFPKPYLSSSPSSLAENTALGDNEHVVLHFHGGSYVLGDGRTSSFKYFANTLLENTPAPYILSPQYRLACYPNSRFPAQLQDALASYIHLLHNLHIPASRVILSGDSSGGHLVLALLRYIVEFDSPSILPPPKCSWTWSPWCDVPAATNQDAWNNSANYNTEYIPASFPEWGATQFIGDLEISDLVEPYMIPLLHAFKLPSPIMIITGGKEVLCSEHEELAKKLLEIPENQSRVDLVVQGSVPHDLLMIAWVLGFKKEATECAVKAGEFVKRIEEMKNQEKHPESEDR